MSSKHDLKKKKERYFKGSVFNLMNDAYRKKAVYDASIQGINKQEKALKQHVFINSIQAMRSKLP